MRQSLFAVLALGALFPHAPARAAAQELPSFATHVALEATLDPRAHAVDGVERLHWVNSSREPATDLVFHLYLNAFSGGSTVFMRESGGQLRGVVSGSGDKGSIEVSSIVDGAGHELRPHARTDLLAGDATQMRVPLAAPVPPGATLDVTIRFRSKLPPVFARAGYVDDFHMVAQWFPKLAVREPDGRWASFPYHGNGEFYADFAEWELVVRAPADYVVGATGERVELHREGASAVHRYVAHAVHDVAFVAWPDFVERTFRVGGVAVRMLAPPGFDGIMPAHERAVREGLTRYGRDYGAYPYSTLTVVFPPRGAEGAMGMEYPTLIVSGGPWTSVRGVHTPYPDDITAHELAHQWFYGLCASDEVTWPMLDEGLTQWATSHLLAEVYGDRGSALSTAGFHADTFELQRIEALRPEPLAPPPGLPAFAYTPGQYGASVYARTAVVLETVRRTFGAERFDRALGRYARAARFRHPVPDDLFAAFDAEYDAGFSRRVLRPALMDGALVDARLVSVRSVPVDGDGGGWRTEVIAQREGALAVPMWIALRDAHGEVGRIAWRSPEPRLRATFTSRTKVVEARLDPDRHVLLQRSRDGERLRTVARAGGGGLFARLLFAFTSVVAVVGA